MARTPKATPNVPAVAKAGLPVKWEDELAKYAQRATKMEASVAQGQFLSTRGGVLKYNSAPVVGNKLDVVILDAVLENAYYEKKFDPDSPASPVCFAFAREDEDLKPHEKSAKPQHETCSGCPMNEFGTADTGRGKACKNIRRLALVPGDAASDPKKAADAELAFLKIPITSVKGWAGYVRTLDTAFHRPTWGVITEIAVVPDPKNQYAITFIQKGLLSDKQLSGIFPRVKAIDDETIMFPYSYTEAAEAPAKPARGKKAPVTAVKPASKTKKY